MLGVANLANTKWCKNPEKWLKLWHMGTHRKVLSMSFQMNTNMTGFRCFSINLCIHVLWMKVASAFEGSRANGGRVGVPFNLLRSNSLYDVWKELSMCNNISLNAAPASCPVGTPPTESSLLCLFDDYYSRVGLVGGNVEHCTLFSKQTGLGTASQTRAWFPAPRWCYPRCCHLLASGSYPESRSTCCGTEGTGKERKWNGHFFNICNDQVCLLSGIKKKCNNFWIRFMRFKERRPFLANFILSIHCLFFL